MLSVPETKSVIVSKLAPAESVIAAAIYVSIPEPSVIVSAPAPPVTRSAPSPALIVSLPAPPVIYQHHLLM